MTHREALDYLDSLQPHRIRPGLERVRALLARLGNPQDDFPSVLIGGTNGKGSVTAYLASILGQAGIGAGVYTSPHLVRFEERITVGEKPIPADDLTALTAEVRAAIEATARDGDDQPTYFEATTALAFLHFSRRRVPIAVLEVGMGGRYDATNVVEPIACAITPIAMDHMQWLGDTLQEIALQKAGILRRGVPAVIGPQQPDALEVIAIEAGRTGAPPAFVTDCRLAPAGGTDRYPDPPVVDLTTPLRAYRGLAISLRGDHQVENAATAVLLAERIEGSRAVDAGAIARGLARTVWPGRIEIVPADGGRPELLLDGAHNPAACGTLADYIRAHQNGRTITLLFAAMKDKPIGPMLDILAPLAHDIIVVPLAVERGETPEALLRLARRRHPRAAAAPDVATALATARRTAGTDGLCVVSGSLYLVGEVKGLLPGAPQT